MKKRALSWLLALTMLLTLAPQTLPVWASATGEKSNTATQTESKLSANTYSALGLSRSIKPSDEGLDQGKQPYGDAVEGNTVATNVINELYVNFNGSIHYGWSILDNIPMEYRDNGQINNDWTSKNNFYGAMGYWRPNQRTVNFESGNQSKGALFATNKTADEHDALGEYINSANKHIVYQYSKSEAFSPNTGKDNYVAEMVLDTDNNVWLYIYQVEGGNKRYVRGASLGKNDFAGDKNTVIWNWEYDAMLDIAAGDMDGDGYDEIAVYSANKVSVYSYENNQLKEIATHKVLDLGKREHSTEAQYKKLGSAIVTLAFGDLDADDKDELVIAENMPYWSHNIEKGTVGIYALENKQLKPKHNLSLQHYNETAQNNHYAIRYVNVATGDIDGDNKDELIAAGYYSGYENYAKCSRDNIWYNIVKVEDGKYKNSGWKSTEFKTQDLLGRVVDNEKQLIPPVSLTCAATQGVGYAEQVFLGGCLYTVKNDNSLEYLTRISTNREYKKDDGKKANKEEIFVVNVVAGNFNGNRNGQEQIVYAFGMKHDDSDRYWYDIGYINKKNPGNSDSDYWYGQEQVMNFESSYNRDSNKRRASLYLSLAAVDCDNDSTLMRYKGQEVTWTKPEVLTILQSAPYFQDLEDTRGYINQGQTGYGKGKGSGSSATAGTSLSVGTYVSFEQDFSVFGVKIASIQAEAQTKHSFNYGYEHNQTVETEVNYSGSAGDDYAVVCAVPYMEYQYETWVPGYEIPRDNNAYQNWKNEHITKYLTDKDANWASKLNAAQKQAKIDATAKELGLTQGKTVKGSWQPCTVSVPMTPRTVMLSVDDYDAIADVTEGLQPIRGNILNSTPGDPTTYDVENSRKDFNKIGTLQTVTKAQGSNISVTQTATTEEEHSFEYEYEFEAKVGAGAGGLTVGVLAGFGANAGGGISKSTSKSYSATVDNLPSDADGYTLSWQFGWRKAKLNNNDVLVLEYQQKDTKAKPSPPKNLRVESVTSNSVTLTWDPVTGAGAYKIYQVEKSSGDLFEMKTLAGTATSWTHEKLNSNSSYIYVAETVTQSGETSITSKEVNASTLEANGNFIITKQPKLTETTYAGGEVNLSVEAEYLNADNTRNELHYQWQVYDKSTKQWKSLRNGNGATYTATVTDENDGDRYRCRVYHTSNLYLYSTEVTLNVGLAESATTLTPTYPSGVSAQAVKSTYFITERVTVAGEYEDVPVIENGRTKYSYQSGNETKYVYVATTIDADEKENYHYYGTSDSTTEITQVEQQVLTFGDESYDINLTGGQTPTGTKTYTVSREIEGVTQNTIYTAEKEYTLNVGESSQTIKLYYCPETDTKAEFWFVEVTKDNHTNQYVADVETVKKLTIDDNTLIDISSLTVCTEKSTKEATTTVQKKQVGDTVKLAVNVADANTGNNKIPTGSVTFKVVNTTGDGGFTKDVEIKDGMAEISWNPTTSGVYTVTAIYSGSDTFKESQSNSYTINVVTPGEQKLVVSGENMTYGESQTLTATLFDGGDTSSVNATPVTVSYAVTRDGKDVANEISNTGLFTPTQAGTYTITASYTDPSAAGQVEGESGKANNVITSTKVITVNRKTVTVVPDVKTDSNGKLKTIYTVTGLVNNDTIPTANIKVTCGAVTSDGKKPGAGVYPITVTYTSDDLTNAKYLLVCDNSKTYEIKDDVVHVTNATTSSNGKVNLSYTYKDQTYAVNGDGGSGNIPKGAKLTATAQPNVGYRVEKWSEKTGEGGTESLIYSGSVYDTSTVITKNNVPDGYSIKADFTEVYYNLTMGFATGNSGSIVAKYLTDAGTEGNIFYSTSPSMTPTTATKNLSPLKKVRITATPAEGQVISGWRIYSGTDSEGALVKNDDGTTYTGNTYTVSTISADTNIVVETDTKTEKTVSVTLKNQDGVVLSNQAYVSFNNVKAEREDGKYTYSGSTHDNIVVTLTIPDSLIVDSWKVGETELNVGTLSNNKKTLSLSNLEDNLDLVVQCKAPNSYAVNVTKQLNGETPSADPCQSITITKNGTANPVDLDPDTSDNKVLEATVLRVVIQPNDGYELLNVTYNGQEQDTEKTGQTEAFTINGVHDTVNIVANFVQKPLVTVNNDADKGDVTVTGTVNRAPGTPKPYADYQTALTILLQPKVGYVVEGIKLNDNTTAIGTDQMQAGNGDDYTYITDSLTADVKITPVWKELAQHTVTFSVVDTNGTEEAGGENGELKATVDRNGIVGYKNDNFTTDDIVYEGSKITFTATPAEGYRVKEWQINDNIKQDYLEETLTLNPEDIIANTKVTVQFTPIGDTATFSAGENGRITSVKLGGNEVTNFNSGFTLEPGATIEVTAEPVAGYEVEQWSVNGVKQSETGNTFTYTAKTVGSVGAAISVTFQPVKYAITWGGTNGRVTAAGYDGSSAEIRGGKALTFTATPANGYKFDHWTVNGVKSEGAMNPLAWTVPHGQAETTPVNSYEIRAVFVSDEQTHTVTYTVNDAAGGTVTTESGNNGSITVAAGTNLTFTAHPNQYYHVQAWMLDGQTVDGTANQLTYTLNNVRATHTVTVVFSKAVSYDVGYAVVGANGTLSATENGTALTLDANQKKTVKAGSKLVFTAAPGTGTTNYMVEEWIVDNTPVTRTNMTELGVKMDHYLSNTLTIESLDKAVTVKVKFKTYHGYKIPQNQTGYVIETPATRIPNDTVPTTEIRDNGDLTFTVKPDGSAHYMTIGTLVVNGYDCIANKVTDANKYAAKCDSVSATKNENGSYTVTIINVKDNIETNIIAHQVVVGELTVPESLKTMNGFKTPQEIQTKLEARLTGRKDGTAFYDITLKTYDSVKEEWVEVTDDNFPPNGVDVKLGYPQNTDSKDTFQIVHMLTKSGREGEIEKITPENKSDGLHFHVDSLSPFGVSWVKYVAPTPGGGGGGGGGGAVSTCTLTFDTNGGSAIDKITKDSGTTIDLAAYKPTRAGYTFAGWFSDKALTKAVTSVKLTANTTVYAKWTQDGGTAENPFVDVKEGAYYYDAVLWAVEQKITSGTSATTFSPDASCTRAQMVTFLWRAAGSPKVENGKNPFTDVKADAYYYDAVLWAVEKGVTSGTSATTFSPDATVTRGQTVTFLYRNAGSPEVSGTMPFTDVEADAYYAKAVQWAVQQKITTGTSETTFSPMSDCTRGQIVTFLYRAK